MNLPLELDVDPSAFKIMCKKQEKMSLFFNP
ncbi:hypothetical protein GCE9029_05068 [Grimontia celer]|uniref:Uncharacterized protein n=1 Tax=Grimontia celer TaxID=1796497 RepID=A0A128FGY9_9GAMM|nr:hypothetical protein GCE9029_05068 [Grimontia celer]